jgi:hypothetical protein
MIPRKTSTRSYAANIRQPALITTNPIHSEN